MWKGESQSTLAQAADISLSCHVAEEACPMNLAPTASTTAALALGDALAMALSQRNGFKEEQFANLHPGGRLGKKHPSRSHELVVGSGALTALLKFSGARRLTLVMQQPGRGAIRVSGKSSLRLKRSVVSGTVTVS